MNISQTEYSMHYSSVDDAIQLLSTWESGALMAKVDLKSAFAWSLFGMKTGSSSESIGEITITLILASHLAVDLPHFCLINLPLPFIGS